MPNRFIRTTLLASALAISTTGVATAATTVTASDIGNHWHTADSRELGDTAHLSFEEVDGREAVVLETQESDSKVQLLTDLQDGILLSSITGLGYTTYRFDTEGFAAGLPSINLRVDLDGDDVVDTYLVYEPYQDEGNDAVLTGEWQTWDAYKGGDARWWGSHLGHGDFDIGCGQSSPCAFDAIVAAYAGARILEDPDSPINSSNAPSEELHGSFGVNMGSGNPDFKGAVDTLTIAVDGSETVYDFAVEVTFEGKEECKDGGWEQSTDPVFRNQGDCVSYFASNGRSHG